MKVCERVSVPRELRETVRCRDTVIAHSSHVICSCWCREK